MEELQRLRTLVADLTTQVQRLMQEKREHQWQTFTHCHGCEWCSGRESDGEGIAPLAKSKNKVPKQAH